MSYIVIPLITVLVALSGSRFTSAALGDWYKNLPKPSWTPGGGIIGAVWTTIFILATLSALIVWKEAPRGSRLWWIVGIFLLNAVLNVGWSWLFFGSHLIGAAVWEAAVLDLTVWALIVLIWPISTLAASLLLPYGLWAAFATYLTWSVYILQK